VWSFALKSLAVLVLRFRSRGRASGACRSMSASGRRVAGRPRADHGRVVRDRRHQPVHQATGDDLGPDLHGRALRGSSSCPSVTTLRQRQAAHTRSAASTSSSCCPRRTWASPRWPPVRAASSCRSATTARSRTWTGPLTHVDTERYDVVAITSASCRTRIPGSATSAERDLQRLRTVAVTKVVAVAERQGRPVKLLVVPSSNVFDAIAQTAVRLGVDRRRARRLGEVLGRRPGAAPRRSLGARGKAATGCARGWSRTRSRGDSDVRARASRTDADGPKTWT